MDKTAYFEQMRDRRRNEILAAAKDMFLNEGIASFSMQQLAKNLDVSTVTLYKYFKNMDDIMQELGEQMLGSLAEKLYALPAYQAEEPADCFLRQMRGFYNMIFNERENISLLMQFRIHLQNNREADPAEFERIFHMSKWTESMKQLLDDMKSRGDTRENLDADAALQFIERTNTALIQYIGMYSDQQYQLEKASLKMYTEQTIDLLLLYLKA